MAQQNDALKLWYTKPADQFEEAMPLGNGRLGAMVYGGPEKERISLNEGTLWSGQPIDVYKINPDGNKYLKKIREALFNEDYRKADSLSHFMQGPYSEAFLPLGTLYFNFSSKGEASDYRRELDIEKAISKVSYVINGTTYTRETFVSYPNQVIVFKLSASGRDKLNFTCNFESKLLAKKVQKEYMLVLRGWAPVHTEPPFTGIRPDTVVNDTLKAMRFVSLLRVLKTDGQQAFNNNQLSVTNATEAVLVLSMATSYNGIDKNPGLQGKDENLIAISHLENVKNKTYQAIKTAHINDFKIYFNRVSIDLGDRKNEKLSTVERLNRFASGKTDNSLVALLYQYSRYLLLSSSRAGGMPANLQGIWNEIVRPPWSSNYTININAEMNYWGAETGNLPETHQVFLDFIQRMSKPVSITAKSYYEAGGWVSHHNTNLWTMTNPVGNYGKGQPCWANWPMGGVWLSTHLWEHYAFTGDKYFLEKQAYPVIKGSVQFCLDFLTEDKKGYLVTAPSTSPENTFLTDKGYRGSVLYGSTADMAMIRELFNDYLKIAKLLNVDVTMQAKVKVALAKLYPYQIGKAGHLQEWYHDWKDPEPEHRHTSHLFAAFPGTSINTSTTPELANAVKKSLQIRTNEGTGWAIAWRINLWARMQNAEKAYDALKKLMRYVANDASIKSAGGGLYGNLFCAIADGNSPFQIDGNLGGGAGIAEMLLQSHQGYLELLPALPAEWPVGIVRGLVARGNFVVDMQWKKGKLVEAEILSRKGGICSVKYSNKIKEIKTVAGKSYRLTFN